MYRCPCAGARSDVFGDGVVDITAVCVRLIFPEPVMKPQLQKEYLDSATNQVFIS